MLPHHYYIMSGEVIGFRLFLYYFSALLTFVGFFSHFFKSNYFEKTQRIGIKNLSFFEVVAFEIGKKSKVSHVD